MSVDGPHRFLFVCGAQRNGTTALARLVGSHDKIVMGVERFKELWVTDCGDQFAPELFERGRFFDFSDGLTNITPDKAPRWADHYRRAAAKFSTADFVGDKIMRPHFDPIFGNFPDPQLLCIVRHPHGVASSWDRRAKNPSDTAWPASWDALASLPRWNRMLRAIADARHRFPHLVSVVTFGSVFESPEPLRAFVERLGLDWDGSIEAAFAKASDHSRRLRQRDRSLTDDVVRSLDDGADWATWQLLQEAAESDCSRLTG